MDGWGFPGGIKLVRVDKWLETSNSDFCVTKGREENRWHDITKKNQRSNNGKPSGKERPDQREIFSKAE